MRGKSNLQETVMSYLESRVETLVIDCYEYISFMQALCENEDIGSEECYKLTVNLAELNPGISASRLINKIKRIIKF